MIKKIWQKMTQLSKQLELKQLRKNMAKYGCQKSSGDHRTGTGPGVTRHTLAAEGPWGALHHKIKRYHITTHRQHSGSNTPLGQRPGDFFGGGPKRDSECFNKTFLEHQNENNMANKLVKT